jgi:hypothetical protein
MRIVSLPAIAIATGVAIGQAPRTITYPAVPPANIVTLAAPSLTLVTDDCELNAVNGIAMQQNGGIVIANSGNRQLCYFDARGALVKKAGRRGAGPGEFEVMEDVAVYRGDSIVVADRMQHRVSVFGPAGEQGRQFLVTSPDTLGSHNRTLALTNGDILLSFMEIKTMAPQKDAVVMYQQFLRANSAGAATTRLARLVVGEHFVQALRPEDRMGSTAYWNLQWGRSTSIGALPSGFVAGDGGDNVIRQFDAAGQLRVSHVVPLSRRPITPDHIASFEASQLKAAKPERRTLTQRMLDEMPYPTMTPAYGAVIADQAGAIWVQSYPDGTESHWLRLDPASGTAKAFRFPPRFRLRAVRADRACGVARDADDLETVQCFTIPKA